MHLLTVQAISAALSHQWDTAITLNQKILQDDPHDFDALNRLAYAFLELGRLDEAEEMFHRVLTLDPKNFIATKHVEKLLKLRNSHGYTQYHEAIYGQGDGSIHPDLFVEEPGRTKSAHLIRIAAKDIVAGLRVGTQVSLLVKNRSVAVYCNKETCVGYLPDDLAFRLGRFMQGGNEYVAFIKSVTPSLVTIFIKETKKGAQFDDMPSFMDTKKQATQRHLETAAADDDSDVTTEYEGEQPDDQFEIE